MVETDRPSWDLPQYSDKPVLIRVGMYVRSVRQRHTTFRVEKLDFREKIVFIMAVINLMDLCPVEEPTVVRVPFEEMSSDFRPTLVGDGKHLSQPLAWYERVQGPGQVG